MRPDAPSPPLHASALDDALDEVRARRLPYPLGSGQAEELALAAGLKPMVRQLLDPHELDGAARRFERAGFLAVVGREYRRRDDGLYDPSSAAGPRVALLVGRDASRLADAQACERDNGDDATRALGRLLGYPRCCVEAFLELEVRLRTNLRLATAAWKRTAGSPLPRLNALDLTVFHFVPWAPCSYRCELSARYADAVAALVGRRFGAFVTAIDGVLATHRLMAADDVQVSLRGAAAEDVVLLDEVWPTAIDRHPTAVLTDAASSSVAALLQRLRSARRLSFSAGALAIDGEPLDTAPGAILIPFGPR